MFWQKSYRLEWYLIIWHHVNLYVHCISFIARQFLLQNLTGAKSNFESMFQQERNLCVTTKKSWVWLLDRHQTKWSLCAAMLCRQHNNKVWTICKYDLDLSTTNLYVSSFLILHLCMKNEVSMLKTFLSNHVTSKYGQTYGLTDGQSFYNKGTHIFDVEP